MSQVNQLDQALLDKIRTLEQQISKKEREQYIILNNLQRRNRELKNQFQQTQRQNMDIKKEVVQLQSKNDHFKLQVENYTNELHDLKQKQSQLLNDEEFLYQEIKYLKTELKQDQLVEQEIVKKNEQIKRLHNTINELEKQMRLLKLTQQQNTQQSQITNLNQSQNPQNTKCQLHQNEEITIPVYVPIIEQQKYIEVPNKQYQVERIIETSKINSIAPHTTYYQPIHYTTHQHHLLMQPIHQHNQHHHQHSCSQSSIGYKYTYC